MFGLRRTQKKRGLRSHIPYQDMTAISHSPKYETEPNQVHRRVLSDSYRDHLFVLPSLPPPCCLFLPSPSLPPFLWGLHLQDSLRVLYPLFPSSCKTPHHPRVRAHAVSSSSLTASVAPSTITLKPELRNPRRNLKHAEDSEAAVVATGPQALPSQQRSPGALSLPTGPGPSRSGCSSALA